MTRQQIIIAIAVVVGPIVQVLAYNYLIGPAGRFIERMLRKWLRGYPRVVRFLTKPRLPGLY